MARLRLTPERERELMASVDWERVDSMTDAQIDQAIASDPDSRLSDLQIVQIMWKANTTAPLRRKLRLLRRALRLSQSEFAAAYRIPLRTLQKWERGETEPDIATGAYLSVIADMPEEVRESLRRTAIAV